MVNLFEGMAQTVQGKIQSAGSAITSPLSQAFGAVGDMAKNYLDMREAGTKNQDMYFHCKGNCEAAQRGKIGAITATIVDEAREAFDQGLKGDKSEDSMKDRIANYIGQRGGAANPQSSCRDVCAPLRPNGLPPEY